MVEPTPAPAKSTAAPGDCVEMTGWAHRDVLGFWILEMIRHFLENRTERSFSTGS
jgi:hypothetical protein